MLKDSGDREMLFFVHILKTGGRSLNAMLRKVFPEQQRYPSKIDSEAQRNKKTVHSPLAIKQFAWVLPYIDVNCVRELSADRKRRIRCLVGHLPYCVGELFDCEVRYISFFRDPVSRTISHIKHARTIEPHYQCKTVQEVYEDPYFFATMVQNFQTRFFAHELTDGLNMAMDPKKLTDDDFARARERIAGLEFVGILEDFNGAVMMLGHQFGFPFETIEKRRFDSMECDVPDGLAERIAQDNPHDMELYEFVKGLYYERRRRFLQHAA